MPDGPSGSGKSTLQAIAGAMNIPTGAEIMGVFQQLNAQGQTIFMVTHNLENAALAHRVLHIRDGVLARESRQATTARSGVPVHSTAVMLESPTYN